MAIWEWEVSLTCPFRDFLISHFVGNAEIGLFRYSWESK